MLVPISTFHSCPRLKVSTPTAGSLNIIPLPTVYVEDLFIAANKFVGHQAAKDGFTGGRGASDLNDLNLLGYSNYPGDQRRTRRVQS